MQHPILILTYFLAATGVVGRDLRPTSPSKNYRELNGPFDLPHHKQLRILREIRRTQDQYIGDGVEFSSVPFFSNSYLYSKAIAEARSFSPLKIDDALIDKAKNLLSDHRINQVLFLQWIDPRGGHVPSGFDHPDMVKAELIDLFSRRMEVVFFINRPTFAKPSFIFQIALAPEMNVLLVQDELKQLMEKMAGVPIHPKRMFHIIRKLTAPPRLDWIEFPIPMNQQQEADWSKDHFQYRAGDGIISMERYDFELQTYIRAFTNLGDDRDWLEISFDWPRRVAIGHLKGPESNGCHDFVIKKIGGPMISFTLQKIGDLLVELSGVRLPTYKIKPILEMLAGAKENEVRRIRLELDLDFRIWQLMEGKHKVRGE